MENQYQKLLDELWGIGIKLGFRVIRENKEVHYEHAREISNNRFEHKPGAIVYPEASIHISICLKFCIENKIPFRVRSGGHQHEGMSSLEEGVVIRLSEMNRIEYLPDDRAWIPVGKALQEVYDELELTGKTIPGGGCQSVNVGGLTQGGGWGTSARKMGLTCDNIEEAEIILATGEMIYARADNEYKDLFWAIRGGGGGNFGIVTKFLFKLHPIGPYISTLTYEWDEVNAELIQWYLDNHHTFPKEFTSVFSMRVKYKENEDLRPLLLTGKYYGELSKLETFFKDSGFLKRFPPVHSDVEECGQHRTKSLSSIINHVVEQYSGITGGNSDNQTIKLKSSDQTDEVYTKLPPPLVTCTQPMPHKISSGFPKEESHKELSIKLAKIIQDSNKQNWEGVRLYMVLHGMPGKAGGIQPTDTAFYYRNKECLLQFQAWWNKPKFEGPKFEEKQEAYNKDQESYINWIKTSRKTVAEELEGAFINFVDRDLPIADYYGENFERLKQIKAKYDENNVFNFGMSIPLK